MNFRKSGFAPTAVFRIIFLKYVIFSFSLVFMTSAVVCNTTSIICRFQINALTRAVFCPLSFSVLNQFHSSNQFFFFQLVGQPKVVRFQKQLLLQLKLNRYLLLQAFKQHPAFILCPFFLGTPL